MASWSVSILIYKTHFLMVIRERVEWVYLVSTGPQKYQSISSDDFYHLNFRSTILYLTEASEVTPAMFCHSLTMYYFICSHLKKSLNWLCIQLNSIPNLSSAAILDF